MPDERLKPFCTDRQWEILEAVDGAGGNQSQAARDLGIARGTLTNTLALIHRRAARGGYSPEHDMTRTVPDGFKVRGVSTYYNAEGKPAGQWVKSSIDEERQREIFKEAIAGMADEIPRAPAAKPPASTSGNLMAIYPVGDHHLGMLSWRDETGADYDLSIAERLLMSATAHLINAVPSCDEAAVIFLGDFMHYDSFESVTPTNRNMLDSDTRFPKMVRAAIRCMRHAIDAALAHHRNVRVIVEIGNHDLASSIFLMECLANVYENEPRLTVDNSPRHFHYFRFGKNLIGTHHGHGAKLQDLPLIMATDRPDDWGQTLHRLWLTGHVHHDQRKDFAGCTVESTRILAPTDAWAANKGHRSQRGMQAIVLHKDFGEVARHIVNPAMLEAA